MQKGKFITFEGIDGCGKTTQVKLLKQFLESKGITVVITREPGGTRVAEKIRKILLDRNNIELCSRAELLLYLASRAQHTDEIIVPALNDGKWVISDRFTDSSVAYQGSARKLGEENVKIMSLFATDGLIPDLTFFLDISPLEASRRMQKQGKALDRLEAEARDFVQKVREGYLWIAEKEPERFIVLNGEKSPDDVWADILSVFIRKFPSFK